MQNFEGVPEIVDFDDLITRDDLAKFLDLSTQRLDRWRWGSEGRPPIPYLRLKKIYFSKKQVIWWLNQVQRNMPDKYRLDREKRLERGITVGRPKTD